MLGSDAWLKSKSYLSILWSSETNFCQEDQIWTDEEWKEWMGNMGIEVGYCWEVSSTQNSFAACCVQNLMYVKIHFKQVINLIGDKFHVQPCRSTNAAQDLDQCLDMQALAGQQWKHMKHRQWFSLHQSISFTYIVSRIYFWAILT